MNKEELYRYIMGRLVVTSGELAEYAKKAGGKTYGYIYKAYLLPLVREGKLIRPKRRLYCAIDPYRKNEPVDRHILASGLTRSYYLSHHTALELLGAAHSEYQKVTVATTEGGRFKPFAFQGTTYAPFVSKDLSTGVIRVKRDRQDIRVSSPSRTFVECILRPDLCGGWEECLKSLEGLRHVKTVGIKEALGIHNGDLVRRKVGYILALMRAHSPFYRHIKDSELKAMMPSENAPIKYMERGRESAMNRDWRLYVPKDLEGLLRGV